MYTANRKSSPPSDVDVPTTDLYLGQVMQKASCHRHGAFVGQACFVVSVESSSFTAQAVCNDRAKRAGFNAQINPMSLRTRPKREFSGSRR